MATIKLAIWNMEWLNKLFKSGSNNESAEWKPDTDKPEKDSKHSVGWPLPDGMTDKELEARLQPERTRKALLEMIEPDFVKMDQELKHKGMTRQLLWEEYAQENPDNHYSYSHFTVLFKRFHAPAAPVPVGSFAANAFGLYDMHGNVSEWVADCYHESYEDAPTDGSAWTNGCASNSAVVRGGSWSGDPRDLRAAYRGWFRPSDRLNAFGFRLVQDLDP